jgi:hypothetical protein
MGVEASPELQHLSAERVANFRNVSLAKPGIVFVAVDEYLGHSGVPVQLVLVVRGLDLETLLFAGFLDGLKTTASLLTLALSFDVLLRLPPLREVAETDLRGFQQRVSELVHRDRTWQGLFTRNVAIDVLWGTSMKQGVRGRLTTITAVVIATTTIVIVALAIWLVTVDLDRRTRAATCCSSVRCTFESIMVSL